MVYGQQSFISPPQYAVRYFAARPIFLDQLDSSN